ncbi:hypothetical protein R5R35_003056 [Gryllus longicercus]|uniref:RNA polymerase II subunit B1 CTD phosphatase RPAP2 homolog n=1 Tax=Gryllus longicercus TaxID=2509291 RepID=A0AAN9VN63_9ORTH
MGDVGHSVRRKNLAKKTGLPRRVKDMSKEQLQATIQKKRECNAKALTIVEHMLEVNINEEWFLQQLKFIDVGHFQDIIEERALSKQCGYPLCGENLKSTPNQQFRISTKYNKVYDITERKNFCSNQCYKAGKYVKDQLLTSPLWLREKEDVPAFKLLPLGSQGIGDGEEVDFGQNSDLKSEVTRLSNDEKFISVADYTQDSISQLSRRISDIEIKENGKPVNSSANVKKSAEGKLETELESKAQEKCTSAPEEQREQVIKEKTDAENVNATLQNKEKNRIKKNYNRQQGTINLKGESSKDKAIDKECKNESKNHIDEKIKYPQENENNQSKSMKTDEYPEVTSSIIHVEKCLHEWFTIETMCFLFGDEKVKELISDKGECIKEYYKAVGKSSWDPIIQERYEALCRKLNIMEIKEQQLEKEDRQLKPLPDYSVLKEENLKMEIKIKAFYQGKLDYEIPESVNKEEKESFTPSCVLPLVDIHAQNALRRRMVLDNLKRVLPDLLRTFSMSSQDISSEVRGLVGSFRLSAHNITFSPPEWNLLGLIIIKMLSIKDMRLKMILETHQGVKYQTMLLMTFQQDGGYLDRLMVWLTDMDNIMKKF